jgi:hypothetical protein
MIAVMKIAMTMVVVVIIMMRNNLCLILFPCSACTWHDIGKSTGSFSYPACPVLMTLPGMNITMIHSMLSRIGHCILHCRMYDTKTE